MIAEMANIAAECVRTPRRASVWSPELGRYVCPASPGLPAGDVRYSPAARSDHTPISPQFKLVFLTAAGGTLLFVAVCLGLSLVAGREPPPLLEKIIVGVFDLAKIGFGAIVGLLGGKHLQGGSPEPAA